VLLVLVEYRCTTLLLPLLLLLLLLLLLVVFVLRGARHPRPAAAEALLVHFARGLLERQVGFVCGHAPAAG
jgi:hypothetical protein